MTTREILHIIHIAANLQRLARMCSYIMQQKFISAVAYSLAYAVSQQAVEPITWIEEYRVYWALWHLQHHSALRKPAKHRWMWSKESSKGLGDIWNNVSPVLPGKIWTVAAILAVLGLRPLYGYSADAENEESIDDEEECHEESSKAIYG